MKVIACGCSTTTLCGRKQCICKNANMSCTAFCKCQAGDRCKNEHTVKPEDESEETEEAEYEGDSESDSGD